MNSYWLESTENFMKFNTLDRDENADVCIIGAGIFGLTTAYYLSKAGLKVIILDKDNIGTKTSGHTTAKITSQHGLFYKYLNNSFGYELAKKYLDANENAITNIENIINENNINCDFEHQNSYVYTLNEDEVNTLMDETKIINYLGLDAFFTTHTNLPFNVQGAICFPNQAQFHPRKYMYGLCKSILENGGKIFTNTTVYDMKNNLNGHTCFCNTGKINSKYVVVATHYPIFNFPGFYFGKMYQSTSYVIGVDTKSDLFDGMYITANEPTYSFRTALYKDKRILLFGGGNHKTGNTLKDNSIYIDLEKKVKKIYPKCEILYKWNTHDCITLDKIPYIGEYSNLMQNVYVGTGFNKWGMTSSNIAANIICDKILGKENEYNDIFESTRIKPIKNREEIKNIIKQTANSLVIEKLKINIKNFDNIKKDTGGVININGSLLGVYRDSYNKLHVVKPICSHLGCLLSWNNIDKTWDCPCHGSRFDYKGHNIYDPAIKDLEVYELE